MLDRATLDAIRERNRHGVNEDASALLAHLDAITEAVEHMPTARVISQWDLVSRRAVLAILRLREGGTVSA